MRYIRRVVNARGRTYLLRLIRLNRLLRTGTRGLLLPVDRCFTGRNVFKIISPSIILFTIFAQKAFFESVFVRSCLRSFLQLLQGRCPSPSQVCLPHYCLLERPSSQQQRKIQEEMSSIRDCGVCGKEASRVCDCCQNNFCGKKHLKSHKKSCFPSSEELSTEEVQRIEKLAKNLKEASFETFCEILNELCQWVNEERQRAARDSGGEGRGLNQQPKTSRLSLCRGRACFRPRS
jgi:hypothetical protein